MDKSLISRIENKLKLIQKHRPLSPSIVTKLKEQFAIEMTYNSNAIEGNRLSLKETYLVIGEGITVKGKSLKEHFEAKDHYEAIHFLYELVEHNKKNTLSEHLIRSVQHLIVKESDPTIAGSYRTGPVMITGSKHQPPEAHEVPILMKELVIWTKRNIKSMHTVELATILHHKLTMIHPFFDGNGRTARLIMNLLLMQQGYPLVTILKNDRKKYYDVLEKADAGNIAPVITFIAQSVERSMNIYLRAIGSSDHSKLLSLSEIAKHTSYTEKHLNLLAREGKIDAHKSGRIWVCSLKSVLTYQQNRQRQRKILQKKQYVLKGPKSKKIIKVKKKS